MTSVARSTSGLSGQAGTLSGNLAASVLLPFGHSFAQAISLINLRQKRLNLTSGRCYDSLGLFSDSVGVRVFVVTIECLKQ